MVSPSTLKPVDLAPSVNRQFLPAKVAPYPEIVTLLAVNDAFPSKGYSFGGMTRVPPPLRLR